MADLKLALDKLGMGKDIEKAFATQPGLVNALAGGMGLDLKSALAKSASVGVKEGISEGVESVKSGNIFARLEEKFKGHGRLLGGFGRYEIGRSFMQSVGLGGGVGGRLGGVALAGFGDKLPGLTAGILSLTVAIGLTKAALEGLMKAAREGAKLYEQSRALGVPTAQASSYIKTLGAVGIDEGTAMRLAAYGEFGRGGRSGSSLRADVAGEMISSGLRGGESALIVQQLKNFTKEINYTAEQLKETNIAAADAAKANYSIVNEWNIVLEKIKTMFQQTAAIWEPVFYGLSRTVGAAVDAENKMLHTIVLFLQKHNIIPKEDTNPQKLTPFARETHVTALEKMGLVIGGGTSRSKNWLQEIAKNTAETVKAITGGQKQPGIPALGIGHAPPALTVAKTTKPPEHIRTTMATSMPTTNPHPNLKPDELYRPWAHGAPPYKNGVPAISDDSHKKLESVFDRFVDRMQQAMIQSRRNELYGIPATINMP